MLTVNKIFLRIILSICASYTHQGSTAVFSFVETLLEKPWSEIMPP